MFEASPKHKKTAASAVAAGALLIGAETAQAHPAPVESTAAAIAGPNAVGAVATGGDPIESHHHFMNPGVNQRLQTDPARGYEGGKGADLGIEGKGGPGDGIMGKGGEAPQKGGAPSGPGPRGQLAKFE